MSIISVFVSVSVSIFVLVLALTVGVCSQSSQWGTGALRRGPKARWNAELALEVNPFLGEEKLNQFFDKRTKRDLTNKGDYCAICISAIIG